MLELKRQKIYLDGTHVGFFHQLRTEDVGTASILPLFDDKCKRALFKLGLPVKCDYVWVSDIAIKPEYRRQGIATKVLDTIGQPNTLVACAPGSGSKGKMRMNHAERLTFYRDLGFKVVIGTKYDYAFKYHGKNED